ncbi:replication initiation protein [Rhizobium laguerreae]|uniref:replication initiation protein n=1 Tax=Rhizobium laguerreae TaxID=1076926 RepID=UPI001C92B432|nr:replication initiation protein [Rhizobium laguerreae]MBY3155561.1 replication initiation protein [Rhizobium laguerreae]MBY3433774.1 replication initiation protein [Rhizobium laguerreae]
MNAPAVYNDINVLKKASHVITATHRGDVVLERQDRVLMDYLLFRAYDELTPQGVYRLATKEVMEYTRIKRHKDLVDSIQRLCRIVLEIDYQDENGEARYITSHFLSTDMSQSENGNLKYAFDPILYHFIAHPQVYANIYIDRRRDMNSSYAMDLYDIMALQYRKKSPVFRTTPDDLRRLLKVGDKHPRPDNFRKIVIEKTVEEVNAIAEFDIVYDFVKGGKGGGIVEIVFEAKSKSHARLVEAASTTKVVGRPASTRVDRKTIDMYDGMNYEERGAPATLTDRSIEGARELMPADGNVDDYIGEWRSLNKNKVFSDPDTAFLAWLKVRLEKDVDPLLKDLDNDVFGDLIG